MSQTFLFPRIISGKTVGPPLLFLNISHSNFILHNRIKRIMQQVMLMGLVFLGEEPGELVISMPDVHIDAMLSLPVNTLQWQNASVPGIWTQSKRDWVIVSPFRCHVSYPCILSHEEKRKIQSRLVDTFSNDTYTHQRGDGLVCGCQPTKIEIQLIYREDTFVNKEVYGGKRESSSQFSVRPMLCSYSNALKNSMFPFFNFCVDSYAEGIGTEGSYLPHQDQYKTPFLYCFPDHSEELGWILCR